LKGGLLKRIANFKKHRSGTELGESNTLTIVFPTNGLLCTSLPSGSINGGGNIDFTKNGLSEKSNGDQH